MRVGAAPQGNDAAADERPCQDEVGRDGERRRVLVVAREGQRDPDRSQRDRCGKDCAARACHAPYSNTALSAAPESSAFGMNPLAPLCATSGPKSDPSRLEQRTTLIVAPFWVRRAATSNPSKSGS
jgi:hypothetical protein